MKTKTITQEFVQEFLNNDFELTQNEQNSRMWGNVPSVETAAKHWIRKNENEVRWILTDNGRLKRFNSKRLIKVLTMAVNYILNGAGGDVFLNSGQPINFTKYIKKTN